MMRCAAAFAALSLMLVAPVVAQAASFPVNDDFLRQKPIVTNEIGLPDGAYMTTSRPSRHRRRCRRRP